MPKMINMTDDLYKFRDYILETLIESGYKYIAKEKSGELLAYSRKPIKKGWVWDFNIDSYGDKWVKITVVSALFPTIRWMDKEPSRITYIGVNDRGDRLYGVRKD